MTTAAADAHDDSPFEEWVNPRQVEALRAFLGEAPEFTRACGCRLFTRDGRSFLDMIAGYGSATLGHNHPRVRAAIRESMDREVPALQPLGAPEANGRLAGRLCAIAGGAPAKVYFANSGAEAIETAMKFAIATTRRSHFVTFEGDFHGLTLGAMSVAGGGPWLEPFGTRTLHTMVVPFGDIDRLDETLRAGDTAAVIMEMVQGLAGARPWQDDAATEVLRLCRRYGTLLVVDEVMTGIGRTGRWFAHHHHRSFTPDIVAVSKGLSGGILPFAAVLMSEPVYAAVFRDVWHAGIHSSTFSGHALGVAVANAVIDEIEERGLLVKVRNAGAELRTALDTLAAEGRITEVRGRGLLLAFRIRGDESVGAARCVQQLYRKGVIAALAANDPRFVKLTPPLTITPSEIDQFITTLRSVLQAV